MMVKIKWQKPIARLACPDCGEKCFVKINKRNNAYFNCRNESDSGYICLAARRWGPEHSAKMIARYHANEDQPFELSTKQAREGAMGATRPVPAPVAAEHGKTSLAGLKQPQRADVGIKQPPEKLRTKKIADIPVEKPVKAKNGDWFDEI